MKFPSLPAGVAWRYLRAPKSHTAVSAISIISVVGVAVATAAIICVLSVFNGFKGLLSDKLDILAPDILVSPASGKVFADADSVAAAVAAIAGVESVSPTVVENALAIFNSREMPVTLRGVTPQVFSATTAVDSIILPPADPDAPRLESIAGFSRSDALVSVGVAAQLGIGDTDSPLMVFAPRREGRVNLANPVSSFITDSIYPAGIFQAMQSDYDEKLVICHIDAARDLFQYSTEATSLEIKLSPEADPSQTAALVAAALGPSAVVKDRLRQQEMNFRMISIEKWVSFLLLIFILLIASFNIISTLCMIIIEKQQSMSTLSALGMTRRDIGKIFWWESLYVSAAGGLAGMVLGVSLCLVQQHFGIIKLGGDPDAMIVAAYPVVVEWSDLLIAAIPVAATGLATAFISSAFARTRFPR